MTALDINTLQLISMIIIIVLTALSVFIWRQNKEQSANIWWCAFAAFLAYEATVNTFPEIRGLTHYVYIFNSFFSFSYFSLMIGCVLFSGLKFEKKYIYLLFLSYIMFSAIGDYNDYSVIYRRTIVIAYNTLSVMVSAYAISKLDKKQYLLEKSLLFILFLTHFALHIYWLINELQFSDGGEIHFLNSLTPAYITLILINICLLLLTLGKIRYDLEAQIIKTIKLRSALSDAVRETNVANKSKSIFLANMSHELRTPLNIILGFSEAISLEKFGTINEKQKSITKNIYYSGKRLLSLINDLLDLSSIQSGSINIELIKIASKDLLKGHIKSIKEITRKYNITLYIINDLKEVEGPEHVFINSDWMGQILYALIDNAAKYGNKEGNIWLNAFMIDADTIRITVKDEGQGIPHIEYENVFKPFHRAGMESKIIEGTGAGLSIVKGLIEAMDASIDFSSELGVGSTFWIDIPVHK